jgi:hypothetical protein
MSSWRDTYLKPGTVLLLAIQLVIKRRMGSKNDYEWEEAAVAYFDLASQNLKEGTK